PRDGAADSGKRVRRSRRAPRRRDRDGSPLLARRTRPHRVPRLRLRPHRLAHAAALPALPPAATGTGRACRVARGSARRSWIALALLPRLPADGRVRDALQLHRLPAAGAALWAEPD